MDTDTTLVRLVLQGPTPETTVMEWFPNPAQYWDWYFEQHYNSRVLAYMYEGRWTLQVWHG